MSNEFQGFNPLSDLQGLNPWKFKGRVFAFWGEFVVLLMNGKKSAVNGGFAQLK